MRRGAVGLEASGVLRRRRGIVSALSLWHCGPLAHSLRAISRGSVALATIENNQIRQRYPSATNVPEASHTGVRRRLRNLPLLGFQRSPRMRFSELSN